MKTNTILRAYLAVLDRDYMSRSYMRKSYAFEKALIARIEAGDQARKEVVELRSRLDTLTRVAMRLAGALQVVEWDDVGKCPWCGGRTEHGHEPDCQRQIALGLVDQQPGDNAIFQAG